MQFLADTNWTLIISVIAGSAALAYAGDVLGFKYGKQRISIFGLRPKYTSRLITAFTGMLISVVVLAILSVFSENVRTALFRMRALQQETHQLALQLQSTRFDMDTLQKDRDMLFNEKNDLEAMALSLRDETEDLRRNLDVMRLGAITVQINSLLAQRAIPPGASLEAVEEVMTALKESARSNVADKRSPRRYTLPEAVVLVINPKEEAEVIARATDSPDRLYVRVLASENTALDERVAVRLEVEISYLLYNEGETVHRKLVWPGESGFDAEETLHVFLRELRNQAIRNGVRPDPATYSVGSLEGEDFFETVEALKQMKEPSIIDAVALQDIYTEGPVRIKILLE